MIESFTEGRSTWLGITVGVCSIGLIVLITLLRIFRPDKPKSPKDINLDDIEEKEIGDTEVDDDKESYPPIEDDLFKTTESNPEDLAESKTRKEVTFDIEVSSESNKKIAFEFLATMYKKHFLVLFIGSIAAVVVLFVGVALFGKMVWFGVVSDTSPMLNAGLLAMPVAMLLVMPLLERNIYARDPWTLARQGMQPLSSPYSKKAYLIALVPAIFLAIGLVDPLWGVNPAFANPFYVLFIVGGVPVVVFEELVFRGVYWKYLVIRYAKPTSMAKVHIINALIFVAIHLPTVFILYSGSVVGGYMLSEMLIIAEFLGVYFLSGLLLGLLKDTFNNLIAPISYHVVFNFIFLSFGSNGLWILIFQGLLLLVFFLAKEMGWFKGAEVPRRAESTAEFNKNILETRLHSVFRLAFLVGNGLVLFYYGSAMSWDNSPLFLVSSIVIIASFTFVGFLYMKRLWIFKLPLR
jgi:membrane protease YdiL (CAAX protease family)